MKNILIPLVDGFEEIEFTSIVDVLRRLELNVIVAGINSLDATGAHGITIEADLLLSEVDTSDSHSFDALVLPGGVASFTLRDNEDIVRLTREFHSDGLLVAALCAAPIVLAKADILRGKNACAFPAVLDTLREAGAVLHDTSVIRDADIITGEGPAAALEFAYAVAEYFLPTERITALKHEMCFRH